MSSMTTGGAHIFPTRKHVRDKAIESQWREAPSLSYRGGQIMSSVTLVSVLWGQAGDNVSGYSSFYKLLTGSYMDWLSEYNTAGVTPVGGGTGSNQTISRGRFGGEIRITPSNGKTNLSRTDVEAELSLQMTNGALPAPTSSSLYFVFLPPGFSFTIDNLKSCDDFCGVHASFTTSAGGSSTKVRYAVIPEPSSSGCDGGCTMGSIGQQLTTVVSHEFVEAVTDPDVPESLAWYDSNNGEVGDICSCVEVAPGSNWEWGTCQYWYGGWAVQKEWSNSRNSCFIPLCPVSCPANYCGDDRAGCGVYCDCDDGFQCKSNQCVPKDEHCPKPGDIRCYCNDNCMSRQACEHVCGHELRVNPRGEARQD